MYELTRTAGAAGQTHHALRNKVVDFTNVSELRPITYL